MTFHHDGRSLGCTCSGWMIPAQVFDELATSATRKHYSASTREFVSSTTSRIQAAAEQLLALIKYKLNYRQIETELVSPVWQRWCLEGRKYDFPQVGEIPVQVTGVYALNDATHSNIQSSLDRGVEPLRAMVHLHRALEETAPSHRWIEATIAAELAIKEVLCRARPELEALLLELPAPPLSKLYGQILEDYLGVSSPFKASLAKGVEKRNRLLHRHTNLVITAVEASRYVADVRAAIDHLLHALYPEDPLYGNLTNTPH